MQYVHLLFVNLKERNLALESELQKNTNVGWHSSSSPSPPMIATQKFRPNKLMRTSSLNTSAYPSQLKGLDASRMDGTLTDNSNYFYNFAY